MTTISLSVRDFALPVPRTGSIELLSGYGRATADGIAIHSRVQKQRAETDPRYRAEVKLAAAFERDGYRFEVGGRVDGLVDAKPPRIEEIKSCFNTRELKKKLSNEPGHPYVLQLRTYGWLYRLEHEVDPRLSFHLVSTRNGRSQELEIALDPEEYERWLDARLAELVAEARRAETRDKRRRKAAAKLAFPFSVPRPGQTDLVDTIERGMAEGSRMLIQAPTGLGKTVGVLFPVLREALARGERVVYVTPKNSQHAVAEDAVERLQAAGAKVRSLTVTAKSKICFKNEPLCNPDYCEYAKDHYTKVGSGALGEVLAKKKKLTARVFRAVAEEHRVCPFELQFEAARDAEVIVCDYNYVFAPRVSLGEVEGKPNLVVDEAHNLFSRALGYYSPELSSATLERMRESARLLPSRFAGETERLIDACLATIAACKPEGEEGTVEIQPPVGLFLDQDEELRSFLTRYLESDAEILPGDVVLRLCFYWGEFTAALGFVGEPRRKEFFTLYRPLPNGGAAVKITCCDASEMLKECYDAYGQVVGFSATLKPFDYYAKLSGLDPRELKVSEFPSPFPRGRRKLLLIREISTKYATRDRNYPKVAEAIRRIAAVQPGNYFAFFPSFEFLERTLALFAPPDGFTVVKQRRNMKADEIEAVVGHLRSGAAPTIVFAVQGGVFAEGVDYPGDAIIGAFVVGPPLPTFDAEREKMRAYYDEHYDGAGFDYAYSYPAMAKAIQAAGRVIRSETDRGLIVLMDPRFLGPSYAQSMPRDWYDEGPEELVSTGILKEVEAFWRETAPLTPAEPPSA